MKNNGLGGILLGMITSARGGISSKIVIGALGFVVLVLSMVTLCFINPSFPGLSEIIVTLIITAASLLGLTTIENTKDMVDRNKKTGAEEKEPELEREEM